MAISPAIFTVIHEGGILIASRSPSTIDEMEINGVRIWKLDRFFMIGSAKLPVDRLKCLIEQFVIQSPHAPTVKNIAYMAKSYLTASVSSGFTSPLPSPAEGLELKEEDKVIILGVDTQPHMYLVSWGGRVLESPMSIRVALCGTRDMRDDQYSEFESLNWHKFTVEEAKRMLCPMVFGERVTAGIHFMLIDATGVTTSYAGICCEEEFDTIEGMARHRGFWHRLGLAHSFR